MTDINERLKRTRASAAAARRERIGATFEGLTDEQLDRLWVDHLRASARRQRRRDAEPRGSELAARKKEVLTKAILEWADANTREHWSGGRLRHKAACEHFAANLPRGTRGLFKKGQRVPWTTIRDYTEDLIGLRRRDYDMARTRAIAAEAGLLNDV